MKLEKVLKSSEDQSVNFIFQGDFEGFFESRFVRRCDDYFVCYLSCQSGCSQGCRQCFLTRTKQTRFIDADFACLRRQAEEVFKYYKTQKPAKIVHFSFMARGEVFDNEYIMKEQGHIHGMVKTLSDLAYQYGLYPRFCLSTIMPKALKGKNLATIFGATPVDLYYSFYSANEEWKKKWMPKAMNTDEALKILSNYQQYTRKIVRFHWPFIKDENDSISDVREIVEKIQEHNIRADFNIVQYNPYSAKYGEPSDSCIVSRNVQYLRMFFPESVIQVIPRVGSDVYASCGTFISAEV